MQVPEALTKISAKAMPKLAPVIFQLKKHAPDILVGAGVASVLGGTALACKATLDAAKVVSEPAEVLVPVRSEGDEDTGIVMVHDADAERKLAIKRGTDIALAYLPAVGMVTGGLSMLVCAKSIEHRRFTAALGMYSSLSATFEEYRARVRAGVGEEAELGYFNGEEKVTVEVMEAEDGKKPKKAKKEYIVFRSGENPLHRIFDECNAPMTWKENLDANVFFLECQERVLNQRLKAEGRIFLNDVYKAIGFDYHEAGQFIGWLADDVEGHGDGFISFGIDHRAIRAEVAKAQTLDEIPEPSIWLTFNCDGEIWDKPLTKQYDI